jgi:hypothetical protein
MKPTQRLGASFLTLMAVAAITALGIWIGHTNPFTTWERLTGWAFATFLFGSLSERDMAHLCANEKPSHNELSGVSRRLPQGLEPALLLGLCGTAEAVPFQNLFMRWLLVAGSHVSQRRRNMGHPISLVAASLKVRRNQSR